MYLYIKCNRKLCKRVFYNQLHYFLTLVGFGREGGGGVKTIRYFNLRYDGQ